MEAAWWFALGVFFLWKFPGIANDQPQWGRAWSRNMTSDERGLPESFDPKTGRNIKWSAELGTQTHSSPIVAGGRVYVGTNNGHPRDSNEQGDRGVLMCFEEATGRFLWQLVVPKRTEDVYYDWPESGISSPVTVEADRVYLVSNRGEVLCLDAKKAGAILWRFDLTTGAGIWSHDAAHSSILVHGNYLYLNSGTGVDNTHKRIRAPDAPSLVVLDRRDGKLVARDDEHIAPYIFHSTWSSPSLETIQGRTLLFFAAGNGILYAFDPLQDQGRATELETRNPKLETLHRAWSFDFDPDSPKTNVHRYNSNRREGPSNFYGMPVVHSNHVYVAGGGDLWWGKTEAWLKCVDALSGKPVWSYPLQKHVLAIPAIYNGLVFMPDCGRRFHCVDAETGQACWTEEIQDEAWASALVADKKVFFGTRNGSFYVLAASREKRLLSQIELGDPISATAAAAHGVLYVATMTRLYALRMTTR